MTEFDAVIEKLVYELTGNEIAVTTVKIPGIEEEVPMIPVSMIKRPVILIGYGDSMKVTIKVQEEKGDCGCMKIDGSTFKGDNSE